MALAVIKSVYYKNPDINSISNSTLQLEENMKKMVQNNDTQDTLKEILDELTKNTISLPSVHNDKLTVDNLHKLGDLFKKEVDKSFYEVFVIS